MHRMDLSDEYEFLNEITCVEPNCPVVKWILTLLIRKMFLNAMSKGDVRVFSTQLSHRCPPVRPMAPFSNEYPCIHSFV